MKTLMKYLCITLLLVALTSCKKAGKDTNTNEITNNNGQSDNVTITIEEYDKLKTGMTYEETKKIIGGGCNKTEANTYYCSGELAGTSATLVFENDKLKEKNQTGLK